MAFEGAKTPALDPATGNGVVAARGAGLETIGVSPNGDNGLGAAGVAPNKEARGLTGAGVGAAGPPNNPARGSPAGTGVGIECPPTARGSSPAPPAPNIPRGFAG